MYNNMKKKVVVTGATSFIGVAIVNEYIKKNHQVIAVVRPNSKNMSRLPQSSLLEIIELDMVNIEQLMTILDNQIIDVFYHLAWEGARAPYRDDIKIQNENYCYAVKAMEAAIKLGCKRFVGAGSQAEYGKCIGVIDEDYAAKPLTEYGKYKLKAYDKLKQLATLGNVELIWTRIFSVYGLYDYEGSLINFALNKMLRNEDIPLTECIQNWDYIYIDDVASIMYDLGIKQCESGIYNIASGLSRPLREFVLEMKQVVGSTSELKFGEIPYSSEGIVSFSPSIDKLKNNLNVSIQVQFEDGIRKIVEYMGAKSV